MPQADICRCNIGERLVPLTKEARQTTGARGVTLIAAAASVRI